MESCDIEAILGDENPPSFVTLNSEQLAPWSQTELSNGMPTDSVQPSTLTLPLLEDHPDSALSGARDIAPPPPCSAAAQVAQAFGRHLSFRASPAGSATGGSSAVASPAEPRAGTPRTALPAHLSSSMEEPDVDLSRQGPVAPPPGAAAAAVARAFARMAVAEKAPPVPSTAAAHLADRSAAARTQAREVSGGTAGDCSDAGKCTLQREGSVPPTPGLAAAQVASAFARLRSSSSSPREIDAAADSHKTDDQPCSLEHHQHIPTSMMDIRACNGSMACGSSHATAQGSESGRGHHGNVQEASCHDSWSEPAARNAHEAMEESTKDSAVLHDGDGHGEQCPTRTAADKSGGGEGKGPNRHAGKGKERASAKAWTEVRVFTMQKLLQPWPAVVRSLYLALTWKRWMFQKSSENTLKMQIFSEHLCSLIFLYEMSWLCADVCHLHGR